MKSPFDLALYQRLIWELQPQTIIEFGALQGASGLWFADHGALLCDKPPMVHSFELHVELISKAAVHENLQFHKADLRDLNALEKKSLKEASHPWLVVDDAHVNIIELFTFMDQFLVAGDYYVIEDLGDVPVSALAAGASFIEQQGYLVDTDYTDGFGKNVTCAPNAWFRKS